MIDRSTPSQSSHFSIQQLSDGVYAVIARLGGTAVCNAAIVDLGSLSLVFDTFVCPSAAEELHRSAVALLGREPDLIVNSHYHNDHIWGNQAFSPPARIVSSRKTCELIQTEGCKELEEAKTSAVKTLEHFKEIQQKAGTQAEVFEAQVMIGEYEGIVQDLSRLRICCPEILFDSRLVFRGSARQAELVSFDDCHSGNDAVLFLPEQGVLFMGDLLFVGCHPYLGDGDALNLSRKLAAIRAYGASTFIPGHGAVGSLEDLDRMREYIDDCCDLARALVEKGTTDRDTLASLPVPERFRDWAIPMFYPSNLRSLCSRFGEQANAGR